MTHRMNFYNTNNLNVLFNLISCNNFPLTNDDSLDTIGRKIFSIFSFVTQFLYFVASGLVLFLIPLELLMRTNIINTLSNVQIFILAFYTYYRQSGFKELIGKINEALIDDKTLEDLVIKSTKPIEKVMKMYITFGFTAIMYWVLIAFREVFKKNEFEYIDYGIPAYFAKEPFSTTTFIYGNTIVVLGVFFVISKKYSIYVYMIHAINLVTAEYKYLKTDLVNILSDAVEKEDYGNEINDVKNRPDDFNKKTIPTRNEKLIQDRLKKWIQYHHHLLEIRDLLKAHLTLGVSMLYVNNIVRFCCMGYLVITMPLSLYEIFVVLLFNTTSLIEIFVICYSIQKLLDASIDITTEAFHGDWYIHRVPIQRTFNLIMFADHMKCELFAFELVSLTLPTFVTILQQAYTACLFFMNMN
uniref:Odorant receptor n=1 Tax=Sirex noctilio TaxID=36765 RepID=A0A857N3M2_9HYME|nr:odorant receptor 30 [Sirex noctilio]